MTIYSALYYPGSLAKGDLIVRDNRFYGGKYSETFPVWFQYLRKHYPDEEVVLFVDKSSPIPVIPLLDQYLTEPWDTFGEPEHARVHVKVIDQFAGQYFRPMQRNLVAAMIDAYNRNESMMWIDSDCFANTDVRPLIEDYDFCAASIEHHQLTAASVFTYVSAARLHAYDSICRLPDYLTNMLNNAPTETRMHSLQEGGLYKLFAWGKVRELGPHIDLTHLSCYDHFMAFLRANPLPTEEYEMLYRSLDEFEMGRLRGVDLAFHDMYFSTK